MNAPEDANYILTYGYQRASRRRLTLGAYDRAGGNLTNLRSDAVFLGDTELVAAIDGYTPNAPVTA